MKDHNGVVNTEGGQKPKWLLDRAREVMHIKHYSVRTEEAYTG